MSKLTLYAYEFYNLLTRGDLINTQSISEIGLIPFYSRIVTKRSIQKVWLITSLPVVMESSRGIEINLTELILGETAKHFPNITVNFNFICEPININTGDKRFISEFQKSNSAYEQYKNIFEEHLNDAEQITGKVVRGPNGRRIVINPKRLVNIRERYESYRYVAEHVNGGGTTALTNMFVHAHAPNKMEMKKFERFLTGLLRNIEVFYTDMNGDMDTYLESYCPAGYKKLDTKPMKQMLFTNENLASLMPYSTEGLIGGTGIPVGVHFRSKLPMIVDFFNSGQAQIIGAYGRTGSGKTFLLQHIAMALLAEDVHVSALDIKGSEWTKLFPLCPGKLISMEGTYARFVNTLRIDDMPINGLSRAEIESIYDMAFSGTVQLLQVMCNLQRDPDTDIDSYNILSNAVKNVYNTAGVIRENGKTFVKTRHLTYDVVLSKLQEMLPTYSYRKDAPLIEKMIKRLSMFLSQDGNFAHIFENELTLNEVINEPLVVYSLNKNAELATTIIDSVRIFMIQYLDTKKQSLRKIQKKHSVVFYEELQRCHQFGKLLHYISSTVTGSRSNNVKVFLLFNSLSTLDNPDAKDIRSNISSWFIGKVNKIDKDRFLNEYGMMRYEEELNLVTDNDEKLGDGKSKTPPLFFAKVDTGVHREHGVIYVDSPKEYQEALRTVDSKE